MSTRHSELATALADALATHLAPLPSPSLRDQLDVARRLKPRLDRVEFAEDTIYLSIFLGSGSWEIIGRQVDKQLWQIVLAVQAALPDSQPPGSGNPFGAVTSPQADPVVWGDSVFELVEQIKDLFRAETLEQSAGPLRDEELAGCYFTELLHDPIYVPSHLEEIGVLTSILQLTYRVVDPDED